MADFFTQSTQYKNWTLKSKEELENNRKQLHSKALEKINEYHKANNMKISDPPPTFEELHRLSHFYVSKIFDYCKYFKFPLRLCHTAITFFQRFYSFQHGFSMFEFDPKEILITCIFLATKTEHCYISLSDYLKKLPKIEINTIKKLEFVVCKSLNYQFFVHHALFPLRGIFYDLQRRINKDGKDEVNKGIGLDLLQSIHDKALDLINSRVVFSDLFFTHYPSQVGLAVFFIAAKEFYNLDMNVLLGENHLLSSCRLDVFIQEIQDVISAHKSPDMNEIKRIDRLLQMWKLPEQQEEMFKTIQGTPLDDKILQ